MVKHWGKAIGFAAGFWGIIFIGVSALLVTPIAPIVQQILEIIIVAVAAGILGYLYFKDYPGTVTDGLVLGGVWFVVSTILDLLITVQYVKGTGSYVDGLKLFYSMWNVWVGFILMVGALALIAKMSGGQARPTTAQMMQSNGSMPTKIMK